MGTANMNAELNPSPVAGTTINPLPKDPGPVTEINPNPPITHSGPLDTMRGAFVDSLKRNNRKIREDRAIAIAESAQIIYKREIEDMELEIKRLYRERDAMLDLSPATADSLILASDFNAKTFVEKEMDLGIKIRNLEIRLGIGRQRYNYLFN